MTDTHDLIQHAPVEVSERAIKELLDIAESLHQRVATLEANNHAIKPERQSSPQFAASRWADALARLAGEMERKEEWWRNQKDDPHNIATGLMVAFAEIKTALRTSASTGGDMPHLTARKDT